MRGMRRFLTPLAVAWPAALSRDQRDRLREELTFAQIDHHAGATDELDVQGILAFAERILPRASVLRVQASLDYKQPAPLFNYLAPSESADERVVSPICASWNQLEGWLRAVDGLRRAA